MTEIKNGILIIREEPDGKCEYCGKVDELRPYGKDGAKICYPCGMNNIEETEKQIDIMLDKVKFINPIQN